MDDRGGAAAIRLRTAEKEDRLSVLPDSLIHLILSFLPSTKQAIQTSILSKRWCNQWTFVSNLIFDFSDMFPDYSHKDTSFTTSAISRILDQTLFLHQCSKIQKFQISTYQLYDCKHDPNYEEKIRLVVSKQAEELIMMFSDEIDIRLPKFFFSQPSLVKLQLFGCSIKPTGVLSWKNLKDLCIFDCTCSREVITSIVSGSPLLQSLELQFYFRRLDRLVIASESLKRLVVSVVECSVDILCPNLVEFDGSAEREENFGWCDKLLEKFLSDSPLLESLKLKAFVFSNLRIASTILKKLLLQVNISNEMQISCPRLEELDLFGCIETIRFMNLPSSVCASLDFLCNKWDDRTGAEQILKQLQHLNELTLGRNYIESLSALEMIGASHSHPFLPCKSLTLENSALGTTSAHIPGIVYALRSLPVLERLVIELQPFKYQRFVDLSVLDRSAENYWNSKGTHLGSLVSQLRTVEIIGFSQKEERPKLVIDFIEFLLKNAIVLEKMVVIFKDSGTDFVNKVSLKLSSFP